MNTVRFVSWVMPLLSACYEPTYDRLRCDTNGDCPGGFSCSAGVCVRPGVSASPGVDASPGADASIDALLPPSCMTLARTCGAGSDDSCCTSLEVGGGTYYRSYDFVGAPDPSLIATVGAFRLDKYEVTVGRFRAFVAAGMGTQSSPPPPDAGSHAKIAGSGWNPAWNTSLSTSMPEFMSRLKCDTTTQTWTDIPWLNENRPINCITWFEAMAFCIWDGGYLPTNAEWNYAAAGGDEQRAYPWSIPEDSLVLDGSRASYSDGTSCVGDGMPGCTVADLVPVGSKPAGDGRWGQSDLAGNVDEWTLDWDGPLSGPCVDCANLTPASSRVIRGGAFNSGEVQMRASSRGGALPDGRYPEFGVRCARSP